MSNVIGRLVFQTLVRNVGWTSAIWIAVAFGAVGVLVYYFTEYNKPFPGQRRPDSGKPVLYPRDGNGTAYDARWFCSPACRAAAFASYSGDREFVQGTSTEYALDTHCEYCDRPIEEKEAAR